MNLAAQAPIPVHALIRPRSGNFHFSAQEQQIMLRDIEAARQAGLAGIVIGASGRDTSGQDNCLDMDMLACLFNHALPLKVSLHRVFDLTANPFHALEQAIALGFERILTSGSAQRAIDALPRLAALHQRAAGRISIMPGGGIDASNVTQIISATKVHEIHASCRQAAPPDAAAPDDDRFSNLGFAPAQPMRISATKIRQLRTIIERFSS